MTTLYLNILGTTLELQLEPAAAPPLERALRFFRHSISGRPSNDPVWSIRCRPYDTWAVAPRGGEAAAPVVIRRSSASDFNLDAVRFERGGRQHFVNEHTSLAAPLGPEGPGARLDLHVSAGSTFQVIELFRDLILRNEEASGSVVLHAAAVGVDVGDEVDVVLLAAAKGGGKTSLLLRLLSRLPVRYVSGDKVLARASGGEIRLTPWRDWPHVGCGTARAFPGLAALIRERTGEDVHVLPPGRKILVDPDAFESVVATPFRPREGRLRLVLMPRYEAAPTVLTRVDGPDEVAGRLAGMIERTLDATYAGWQTFSTPHYDRQDVEIREIRKLIAAIPFLELRGDLALGEADVGRIRDLIGPAPRCAPADVEESRFRPSPGFHAGKCGDRPVHEEIESKFP